MKNYFFFLPLFLSSFIYGQQAKKIVTKNIHPTANGNPKAPADFKKKLESDSLYTITGSVMVKNGHDEKMKVVFTASVLKVKWDEIKKNKNYSDYDVFNLVASMLNSDAKYKLKNKESFVPLPTQFFMWNSDRNSFISNYKMMGRNGFGNLSETTALVEYNPFEVGSE